MRLIDADELIKKFLNVCRTEFEIKNKCMADENVIALIHNAPTVDKGYQEGHIDGVLQAEKLYARPIGEWKQISPAKIYECTNCGQTVMTGDIECYQFCHSCGADMRGEEAENE